MSIPQAALVGARKQIQSFFDDVCTVYYQTNVTDETTHRTRKSITAVYTDIPCRLSFSSLSAVSSGTAPQLQQSVKLFTAPDVDIKPGSRIHVVRSTGAVSDWKLSGLPAVYETHREIMLEPYGEYA